MNVIRSLLLKAHARCSSTVLIQPLCLPPPHFRQFSSTMGINSEIRSNIAVPASATAATKLIARKHTSIVKSPDDQREYRGLELNNGLRMLLISDPKTDKSAASMDVNVGHLMDPWELPGLAHFCEHMLFLGTAKYPSENEYSKFISSHGGGTNAFTSADHTNYHFDIAPDHLDGALDRFVQFFLSPQFTESATEREVLAVDSEFSNSVFNDQWRMLQLERSLSKPLHDYGKFGTGNKQTLMIDAIEKGIEPRKALLKFHEQHYSSDIMCCTILGKQSLDELEEMVGSLNFSNIERKNVKRKIWEESPYEKNQLATKIEVVPVKDLRYLTLTFPIADYKNEYRSQPGHYVAHLIGHEGPGSLLSELKRRGWVSSLSAGDRLMARGFSNFSISVDLREEGLLHTDDIAELIFSEINLVKTAGPLKWVHDELHQLAEIKFRFKDKESPLNYATHLSAELQRIPFEDVICFDYKMDKFKPELIMEVVDQLRPDNMFLTVVSNKFADRAENLREKWYETEYQQMPLDKKFLERCLAASVPDFLHLPTKNDYIATNFELKSRDEKRDAPVLIHRDDWSELWFMQDNEFNLPKLSTKIAIKSPMMQANPLNAYLSAMFAICLQDAIAEETYNPYLAGLSTTFDIQQWGISLRVSGYDEKQSLYINNLVKKMVNFVPDGERYEVLKESFCRNLRNFRQTQPYMQTHYYSSLLLSSQKWTKEQVLACALNCGVDSLQHFARSSLQAVHIEAFAYGNSTKEESLMMIDDVVSQFKSLPDARPLFDSELEYGREYEIPKGKSFVYKAFQPTHPNASINYIMQTGPQSARDNVFLELIVQLAAEPAFNQLRTNEQLGYIVHTGCMRNRGVQSLQLLIQGQHEPEFMEERIESFVKQFRSDLEAMPESEFRDNVEALAIKRLEKPKTMKAKANRFWSEIESGFYHFNRELSEVPILRQLTKAEVLEYYDKHFSVDSDERRKLCAMVYANTKDENSVCEQSHADGAAAGDKKSCVEQIDGITSFKSGLSMYPLPQPVINIKVKTVSEN